VAGETTSLGTVGYTYDAIGRRTTMTVSGQPAVNYTYDADSRLRGVTTTINGAPSTFDIGYDGLGRCGSIALPNGVTTSHSYDNDSQLLNLQHLNPLSQVLESLTYTYDAVGNRVTVSRPNVSLPLPSAVVNTSYNPANRMLTFNDKNIAYDLNGNMTSVTNSCGTTNYTWDARNRLVGISGYKPDCSALAASFKYDAVGRRIEKTINGRTIDYLYDGKDIAQEIENGSPTVDYIRTLNMD
jgi:YD repeat-containing protein